jgi:hypothetical protein
MSGERTSVIIRDNDTLAELGKAYDLMNTNIYEEINNKYTLDFNILPYFNVYRIMHPNFLELNNDYFRIMRVEKRRTNTLMMAISCEHMSYELNVQYELDMANEVELPDYPYSGTPTEILTEMLAGSRFTIGTVDFTDYVDFTSKPMGTRSMIIGLANQIGAEVKWDKFSVSLLSRRGSIRDLSFEVGKNLISMTEVYDTHANGFYTRSYDVDVIDLSLIEDNGVQEEMYDIRLGDTISLIDEQFNINITQRVVSYQIDPFRKELPIIELEHVRKNITNTVNDIDSKPVPKVDIYQEGTTRNQESNAFGYQTVASGYVSHAEGYRTTASGSYSHAEGRSTIASGFYSHAEGSGAKASGECSHAEGLVTEASNSYSHAEGERTKALGRGSHSQGYSTTASGEYSHAEGVFTTASGPYSHAEGYSSVASMDFSHAGGNRTIADQVNVTAIGKYNKPLSVGDIFVIGVGAYEVGGSRANGFRVTTAGATYGQSAFNSAGADYAEYFEWEDGNPNNDDRKGYFVTLDGDKIRMATSTDDYIVGIVSVNPSVIGDSYQDQWANMYLTNEWGEIQKETVTIPAVLDEEGKEISPERDEIQSILNPNYDSSTEYTPREKRAEWSPIGMMGKLLVRDDGTTLVNGYCKPNDNGVATSSTEGYRVMERVSQNIIRVLVK